MEKRGETMTLTVYQQNGIWEYGMLIMIIVGCICLPLSIAFIGGIFSLIIGCLFIGIAIFILIVQHLPTEDEEQKSIKEVKQKNE
jgi:hypothetical protein